MKPTKLKTYMYTRTYRILGFISLACNLLGCILIKDRIPQPCVRKKLGEIIGLSVFRNRCYSIWCLAGVLQMMAYYVPYFFVPCNLYIEKVEGKRIIIEI